MWKTVGSVAVLACATVAFVACGENAEARRAAAQRERMAALAADPELTDALGRSLLAQIEHHAPGWVKHERVLRGSLAEKNRHAFLLVLPYGHCYRVVAAGGPAVLDLDLALYDANNVEIARDVTQDPRPGLGLGASICPADAGAYRLEARMRRGRGDFAIAVVRTVE